MDAWGWAAVLLFNPISATLIFWVIFIAGVRLHRTGFRVPTLIWRVLVVVFYVFDALYDWIYGTLWFLELPRDSMFSNRINRHLKCTVCDTDSAWIAWKKTTRRALANRIKTLFFDRFDDEHFDDTPTQYWR